MRPGSESSSLSESELDAEAAFLESLLEGLLNLAEVLFAAAARFGSCRPRFANSTSFGSLLPPERVDAARADFGVSLLESVCLDREERGVVDVSVSLESSSNLARLTDPDPSGSSGLASALDRRFMML